MAVLVGALLVAVVVIALARRPRPVRVPGTRWPAVEPPEHVVVRRGPKPRPFRLV